MKKMNKSDFIQHLADSNHVSYTDAEQLYYTFVNGVIQALDQGNYISLAGFGNFYLQRHKGHPVQFKDAGDDQTIHDYTVLKFSAGRKIKVLFRDAKDGSSKSDEPLDDRIYEPLR